MTISNQGVISMVQKIVIASDSFKRSASSKEIGEYSKAAILEIDPDAQVQIVSIADGGEGTAEAIIEARNGKYEFVTVKNPIGKKIQAKYGVLYEESTAIIEMAEASGLTLLEELDVMHSSTYGTGQLILHAVESGIKNIYIGIGGSATNDGGMGMAEALGYKFYDDDGKVLVGCGANLNKVTKISAEEVKINLDDTTITVLSDVTNPLCGIDGAAAVYGPQKGADTSMIEILDKGLYHFANVIKNEMGVDIIDIPGAGAAGGLGAGLMVFANAVLKNGIETLLEIIGIEERIKDSDLVITGEGNMDSQSVFGKAPIGIATIAKQHQVPIVAIVGGRSLDLEPVYEKGIDAVFSIVNRPMELEESIAQSEALIKQTVKDIYRFYLKIKNIS